ncbi:carbon starvation CstA family protein [Haloarcula salinisoli]|uniref:Carbon starvation protein A n=1 Tax=Haloarcula salinisoli TaxID=2487746 RepID=A0A8J7YG33_9EURY|nr:carbon starvation CstA family protein [Halomicroarcula salinisoli]MBX0286133.1 carbon starvation protein A [Halomicroarcula salinisoli]MBX0302379.1 carbon starvation protein A [Halomicroarcula salinisoli]
MVQVIWLVAATLLTFSIGYLGYSRYLSQFVELDDDNETPAHKYEDGQEYVPSKKPVLLGHHYSSIAGGAPIVGPITAGVVWGWVPALLWIAIGNPLMGAVHDFVSLSGSLRHEGKSIGYIIGEYVGERGKNMLLWFAFLTIILVVAVFALVVAIVFNAYPAAATASFVYIALALIFGVYLYQLDLPFIPGTAVFVSAVFAGVWVGITYPIALFPAAEAGAYPADTIVLFGSGLASLVPAAGTLGANTAAWIPVVLVYAAIASVLPVWTLLQPRDFLSSFLLYAGVGGTLLAIIVGTVFGTSAQPLDIALEPYYGFMGTASLPLFPLLFVTIACGTISGFHSLVSSGTTAKQLNKESDARAIGYGGMLGEGLLATVALGTVAIAGVTAGGGIGRALPNFASGGSVMLTSFGIPTAVGAPFMALVLVSFLLTSTDTAVRLGRYMAEEIVGTPDATSDAVRTAQSVGTNRYSNAVIQCLVAYALVASGSWASLWPLFGGANQLLAALALLTATVWLANWDSDKQLISTGVPMALMTVVTICALLYLALYQNLYQQFILGGFAESAGLVARLSVGVQILLALVLVGLALSLVGIGYRNIRDVHEQPAATPADD